MKFALKGPNKASQLSIAGSVKSCAVFTHHASRITHQSAFTLAEVLAALVFMAILIPVALEGLSIASRAGEVAARKSMAALVAESVLNENVIATNYANSLQNGTVRQGDQDFRWTLKDEPWNKDPNATWIRQLSIDVAFSAQGRDYSVSLSTLVDTTPPTDQTATTTQQ